MNSGILNPSTVEQEFEKSARNLRFLHEADISIHALFETKRPLEVEIGCGKGKFLLGRSQSSPETNFLGIDTAGKWMKIGRVRSEKRQIPNLRFFKADFREVLLRHLRPESVEAFHIYFPDPWPKKRHQKRRLVQSAFLRLLYDRLCPGGHVYLATDDENYYLHIEAVLEAAGLTWNKVCRSHVRPFFPEFKTNYELKYEKTGKKLYYLELEK